MASSVIPIPITPNTKYGVSLPNDCVIGPPIVGPIAQPIPNTVSYAPIIFPAFLNDNGMSATNILLLYFVFGISRVVSLALAGKFAKRTSQTLIAATLSVSIGLGIAVIADSIITFGIALVLMGFGFSIFFPLTLEIVLSKTRKQITGKIIGAYETIFGIGWALGPTIGGPITQTFGDETPYLLFCVIGIGVTLLAITSRRKLEPEKIEN